MSFVTSRAGGYSYSGLYVGDPSTGQTGAIATDGLAINYGIVGSAGRQLLWSNEQAHGYKRPTTTFYDPKKQQRVGAIKNWPAVDRYLASPDGSRLYALQHMLSEPIPGRAGTPANPGTSSKQGPAPFVLRVYDAASFALIEAREIDSLAHGVSCHIVLADGRLRALTHLYDTDEILNQKNAVFTGVLTVDPTTGAWTHDPLPGHMTFVEFSPSGKHLLHPHSTTTQLWTVEPAQLVRVFPNVSFNQNPDRLITWQPDEAAFWFRSHTTVACVGLNGRASPPINIGDWQPVSIEPTGDRAARLICLTDKLVTIDLDGSPGTGQRVVGKKGAHIKFHGAGPDDAGITTLAERLASEKNTLVVPMADKSEGAHIGAIERLAQIFEADEIDGRYSSDLAFAFELKGKRITDKKFFGEVTKSMPAAAPAMKRMVEAFYAMPNVEAWEDCDTMVAALKAFVELVPDGVDVLVHPTRRVSIDGRFFKVILPFMIQKCGWTQAMIEFVVNRVMPHNRGPFFTTC